MTFDSSAFYTYRTVTSTTVEMDTKAVASIAGICDIIIEVIVDGEESRIKLTDVLHVPYLDFQLIST